ncbi:hypothetical protein J1N35_025869 [Gossypium stocksii]|uniref:Uncharacterized protein n=1 Tax=Gossypium stocksii TaxID=47602 RepID=A0A9D3V728_9ROSI|nr:hypothetical protein J1N35_025869 [Gossypium stocksii]
MPIRVSKLEEGMHLVQANMSQIQGQLNQILQVLQIHATSSILGNTKPNPKRVRKEYAKVITLQSKVMIKESVRPSSVKIEEMDINTQTPSVRDRVEESVKKEVELKESNHKKKSSKPPSPTIVPFPKRLEERKKMDNEEFLSFLNMFKALNVNLHLLKLLEKIDSKVVF